jgi:hypothetical protein
VSQALTGTQKSLIEKVPDVSWLASEDVRPYIYMRKENLFANPGERMGECKWFPQAPLFKNPLQMSEVDFADQILNLESKAFQKSAMPMPRWVFYDCGVMPGFVCGFARRTASLSDEYCAQVGVNKNLEWTPVSLFIIIPTIRSGEWVAHNLCTANSLLGEAEQKYALGFLTKAFGLWYANVEVLCGMTQWQSPAIRLHSHFGPFEVLTAYTPVHSYARTLTYRCRLDFQYWPSFFTHDLVAGERSYQKAGLNVNPSDDASLKSLQLRIEKGEGPFYLSSQEIRTQDLQAPLNIYRL